MSGEPLMPSSLTTENYSEVAKFFELNLGTSEAIEYLEAVLDQLSRGDKRKKTRISDDIPRKESIITSFLKSDTVSDLQITLIIQIPEDVSLVSRIIGLKGSNINEIIKTSECRVKIERIGERPLDIFRHVFIAGKINNVIDAFQRIFSAANELANASFTEKTRVVVPTELTGGIIGKGGLVIKDLKDLSGVSKIEVQSEQEMQQRMHFGVYGRTITFTGDVSARHHAVYLLLRQIAQDRILSFEWKGDIPRLLSLGGGGGGGGALHRGGPGPGAMMPRPNAGRGMYGAPGMTATFPRPIATPLMMPMPGGVGPGIGGGGLGGGVGASLQQTQIKIPNDRPCIGMLIGPNGAAIDELQRQYGCTIAIERQEDPGDPTHRTVTISGASPQHVSMAGETILTRVAQWRHAQAVQGGGAMAGVLPQSTVDTAQYPGVQTPQVQYQQQQLQQQYQQQYVAAAQPAPAAQQYNLF